MYRHIANYATQLQWQKAMNASSVLLPVQTQMQMCKLQAVDVGTDMKHSCFYSNTEPPSNCAVSGVQVG